MARSIATIDWNVGPTSHLGLQRAASRWAQGVERVSLAAWTREAASPVENGARWTPALRKTGRTRPIPSSTSPVTAGFVALLKSVRPTLTPTQLKRILMSTARVTMFEGQRSPRTVDIAAALRSVTKRQE